MCAQAVSAGGVPAIATPVRRHKTVDGAASAHRRLGPLGMRLSRLIGRGFLGLPVSSWLIWDLSVLVLAIYIGYGLFPPPKLESTPHTSLWQACAVFAFSLTTAALVFGLYDRETLLSRSRILTRMLLSVGVATIVAYAIIYVIMYSTVSRRVACLAMGFSFVAGSAIRLWACWAIHTVPRGLLVVSGRALFESFQEAQKNGLLSEYRLLGYATTKKPPTAETTDRYYLGHISDQIPTFGRDNVTDIVVGADAGGDTEVMEWLLPSLQQGCRVLNEAVFYEKAAGQILVDEITPAWFLFADLKTCCDRHAIVQRVVDLVTACVGLCLSAPLWPVIALAIKLCDRGPAFYSQERVGQNGRVFKLYKFRTMRVDAESGKSVWASPDDPRITRVGRWLRKTRLDELPQLYNTLIGEMSIVGPRPERPDIVRELCEKIPYYAERHLVTPGITGWAQISYRYGSSIEDAKRKLQFDLYYLKNMSFELDMIILLRTVGTFLRGAC